MSASPSSHGRLAQNDSSIHQPPPPHPSHPNDCYSNFSHSSATRPSPKRSALRAPRPPATEGPNPNSSSAGGVGVSF